MSRGLAAFSHGHGHLAVMSHAVVTVVSHQSWLSRESCVAHLEVMSHHGSVMAQSERPTKKTPQSSSLSIYLSIYLSYYIYIYVWLF